MQKETWCIDDGNDQNCKLDQPSLINASLYIS